MLRLLDFIYKHEVDDIPDNSAKPNDQLMDIVSNIKNGYGLLDDETVPLLAIAYKAARLVLSE